MTQDIDSLNDAFQRWIDHLNEADEDPDTPAWARREGLDVWLRDVFPVELEDLRSKGQGLPARGGALISCVGFSPQPILLLIALLQPSILILLHTGEEGSQEVASKIEERLGRLGLDTSPQTHPVQISATQTVDIFTTLRHKLLGLGLITGALGSGAPNRSITIDITGGKKSMVSAAYLFAAEFDTRILYLDGEYNPQVHLPRPGTLRPVHVANPISALALRQIRAVHARFKEHDYQAARSLLDAMRATWDEADDAQRSRVLEPLHLDALRSAAEAFIAWENANYPDAQRIIREWKGVDVPYPIQRLSAFDFDRSQPAGLAASIRNNAEAFLVYLVDTWRWLDRRQGALLPRDAFLRLFVLGEFATEGMWAHLAEKKLLRGRMEPAPPNQPLLDLGVKSLKPGVIAREIFSSRVRCWLLLAKTLQHGQPFAPDEAASVGEALRRCGSEDWFTSIRHQTPRGELKLAWSYDEKTPEGKKSLEGVLHDVDLDLPEDLAPPPEVALWVHSYGIDLRNACAHRFGVVQAEEVELYLGATKKLIDFTIRVFRHMGYTPPMEVDWWSDTRFEPPTLDQILAAHT